MRKASLMSCLGVLIASAAMAQQASKPPTVEGVKIDAARIDQAIAESWPKAPAEWKARFSQDALQRQCSQVRGVPSADTAKGVQAEASASIKYPVDGTYLGDWRKGEAISQSGYGLRFTDTDAARANGGNCYACHQIDPKEVSYGTIGPSLTGYGLIRRFQPAEAKAVYEKIYNPHAVFACSNMPRFGTSGVLSVEQIRDLVALLMDPASPVNAAPSKATPPSK